MAETVYWVNLVGGSEIDGGEGEILGGHNQDSRVILLNQIVEFIVVDSEEDKELPNKDRIVIR